MHPSQCPLFQPDIEYIRQELLDMPLQKLIFVTEGIMDQLTPVEMINYTIGKFVNGFNDKHGRIAWIEKLIDDGIIAGLQYPHNYYKNPRMVDLMKLPEYRMQFPFGKEEKPQSEAALTDDLEIVSGPVTIANPRWEHTDKVMIEHSPNIAMFGDTVMLMADVTGVPEGASIMFDIYDTSENPPMVMGSVQGQNKKGIATGKWVVSDKSGKGAESKLEFEGTVRSKLSGKCPIELKVLVLGGIHILFEDQNRKRLEGVSVKLSSGGTEIFAGIAETGELGITDIPFAALSAECSFNGTTTMKDLHWNGGPPPYTIEMIVIPSTDATGEEA